MEKSLPKSYSKVDPSIILTYKSTTIRYSDLAYLTNNEYLNDECISFYYEYLSDNCFCLMLCLNY